MLEITAPYSSLPYTVERYREQWKLGNSSLPVLKIPTLIGWRRENEHSVLSKISGIIMPPSRRALPPKIDSDGIPLPWVWGDRWTHVTGQLSAFLDPHIIDFEKSEYFNVWRSKWELADSIGVPKLSYRKCLELGNLGEHYCAEAYEASFEKNLILNWSETVTGRLTSSSGIPWQRISHENRYKIISLEKNDLIFYVDIKAAEPTMLLSVLEHKIDDDPYMYLSKIIDVNDTRDKLKVLINKILYSKFDNFTDSGGNLINSKPIKELRNRAIEIIEGYKRGDKYYSICGRYLDIEEENQVISYFLQSSASEYALVMFNEINKLLKYNTNSMLISPIHDGCMWLIKDCDRKIFINTLKHIYDIQKKSKWGPNNVRLSLEVYTNEEYKKFTVG
jgi:hypothetical protein